MSAPLSFEGTIDRVLVHRASVSEVFPTDFQRTGEGSFLVGLQWPRGHRFYRLAPLDSSVVVETIRQITILTAHRGFGASLDTRFVMSGLGFHVLDELELAPGCPVEITGRVTVDRIRRTGSGVLRCVRVRAELAQGERPVATGYGDAVVLPPRQYARLRGPHLDAAPCLAVRHPRPEPSRVGRIGEDAVTIQNSPHGLEVIADPRNPVLFDHLVDHLPGAALIDACLQSVRMNTGDPAADFASFDAVFHKMVEFGASNALTLTGGREYEFVLNQDNQSCMEARGVLRDREEL